MSLGDRIDYFFFSLKGVQRSWNVCLIPRCSKLKKNTAVKDHSPCISLVAFQVWAWFMTMHHLFIAPSFTIKQKMKAKMDGIKNKNKKKCKFWTVLNNLQISILIWVVKIRQIKSNSFNPHKALYQLFYQSFHDNVFILYWSLQDIELYLFPLLLE